MANDNVTRRLSIYINDTEVVNSMSGITKAIGSTRAQMNALVRGTEDYDTKMEVLKDTLAQLTTKQSYYKDEINGTNSSLGIAKNSLQGVEVRMKAVEKELRQLDASTDDYNQSLEVLKNEYVELSDKQKQYSQNINTQAQQDEVSANSLAGVTARMEEVKKEMTLLDATSAEYQERMEGLRKEYASLDVKQKEYNDNVQEATRLNQVSKNSLAGVELEMQGVQKELRELDSTSANYREELVRLHAQEAALTQQHGQLQEAIEGTPGILDSIKEALGPVASGMLVAFSIEGAVDSFKSAISDAFNTVVNFNQKQADLAAIMGKSRTQIRNLTYDAIKYGASTAYSATEVSELQTELARLGKTEPEIRKMTGAILNSATALESGLGEAAELVGGQLNSYSENASQAQRYSDIMANSVNVSATSFESLSTALPKVSAVAAQEKIKFEELNAVLGTLADQNIAAETAGTGFRNILLTSAQAGKPYQEMLDKVKNSTNQTSTATEIFGKENATVAVILANSSEKINANTKALENSAGSAEKLAKEKMNSIKGSIDGFSGAWEGFILSIEKGDGPIGKAIKGFIDMGTAMINLLTPTRQLSDELFDEQVSLNQLVSKITSTNTSNEERKRLLIQLKEEYPDFIGNIDVETVSNSDLNKELIKVNDQYIKRIILQKEAEKVQGKANDYAEFEAARAASIVALFKNLTELKAKYNLQTVIDFNNLKKSAGDVEKEINTRQLGGLFRTSELRKVQGLIAQLKSFENMTKSNKVKLDEANKSLDLMSQALGVQTEEQRAATEATKVDSKEKEANNEVLNATLENQLKQLSYTKNRREAMGQDTYNVESQIYKLQQQLYKDDVDKYEEATNNLLKLQYEYGKKSKEAAEKLEKDREEAAKKALEKTISLAKANLDYYISAHTTKIDKDKELTSVAVEEEVKRLEGIKQAKIQELAIEKQTNDGVIAIKKEGNIELSVADIEYLTAKQNADIEFTKETEELKKQYTAQEKARDAEQAQISYDLSIAEATSKEEEERLRREQAYKDEKAQYDKLYQDKKITYDQYSRFIEAMDKKQKADEKARELEKTQQSLSALNGLAGAVGELFGQSKELAFAQALINGALAVTSILAQYPKFDGGFAMTAAIAAAVLSTTASLKKISETKAPKKAKFFYGGYTGSNVQYPDEYGGVAQVSEFHPNEYVIPAKMMAQPAVARTAEWLEGVRTGKAESPENSNGFQQIPINSDNSGNSGADPELKAMLSAIAVHLQNPVSPVIIYGYEDLERQNKLAADLAASKQNGKLNQ